MWHSEQALTAEEELSDELTSLGIEGAPTLAQQQATLTLVMRRMSAIQKGLDTQDEACRLEVEAITDLYAMQTRHERARLEEFKRFALNIAEGMEWGKKKSHDSPYGTAGVRDAKATVECTDRNALSLWAVANMPSLVEMELTLPLALASERFTSVEMAEFGEPDVKWKDLKAFIDPEQELPPGVTLVPAARTPFVKLP